MTYRKGKTIWKRAKVNRHEISLCNYFGRGSFNERERERRSSTDTRLSYFITEEEDDDAEGDVEGEVEDEEEDA